MVEHGDARDRQLGFPTANLPIHASDGLDGIWAAYAVIEGMGKFQATVSVGQRPTYYQNGIRIAEAHLLDFAGDLYGRHLLVELINFLRPQVHCASEAELIALIEGDIRATRAMISPAVTAHRSAMAGTSPITNVLAA